MFWRATSFNQDIGDWDVSSVYNLNGTFLEASSFDQNLGDWNLASITGGTGRTSMWGLLSSSGISVDNYDSTLMGWQVGNYPPNVEIGVHNLNFCASDSIRALMVANGWSFRGDSLTNACLTSIEENNAQRFSFEVFPTLSTGIINLNFKQYNQPKEISIYNAEGKEVLSKRLDNGNTSIDLSPYPNGIYFIRNHWYSQKVILRK